MSSRRSSSCRSLSVLVLLVAGCDGPGTDPKIYDLSYGPTTAVAGEIVRVEGQCNYHDPDGDVDRVEGDLAWGENVEPLVFEGDSMIGSEHGTLYFTLELYLPEPATTYTFGIWLIDETERESGRLHGTITTE